MENQEQPQITITPTDTSTVTVNIPIPTSQDIPSDNLQNPTIEAPQNSGPDVLGRAESSGESIKQETAMTGEIVEARPIGRPSKYKEEMVKIAKDYYIQCLEGEMVKNKKGEMVKRKKLPLIEELARLLDIDGDTIVEWEKDEAKHDFSATIKKIRNLQKEAIINRGFSMTNPTFAIFMLKANHGMMETEKRVLMGEKEAEPMSITVQDYKGASKQIAPQVAQVIEEGSE